MQRTPATRAPGSGSTGPTAGDPARDVELVIPACHRHVRLARLAASGIGASLDVDVERIEELRLLVDEACALLLECTVPDDESSDRLHVTFRPSRSTLEIVVERSGAQLVDRPSPTSVAVLDGISDHWSLDGATVSVIAGIGGVEAGAVEDGIAEGGDTSGRRSGPAR